MVKKIILRISATLLAVPYYGVQILYLYGKIIRLRFALFKCCFKARVLARESRNIRIAVNKSLLKQENLILKERNVIAKDRR